MPELQERSTPTLVGDLVTNVTELVRKEIQLFRAEMGEKSTQAVAAVGSIVVAIVLAITALNVLAGALVVALTNAGLGAGWAALIVGGVFAVVALILANRGISNLKAQNLAPERTARAAMRDANLVKEKM